MSWDVIKQGSEKPHQFVLALAGLLQKRSHLHLVRAGAVTGASHVAARLFMLDEQAVDVRVQDQAPSILVRAVVSLIERFSQQGMPISVLLLLQALACLVRSILPLVAGVGRTSRSLTRNFTPRLNRRCAAAVAGSTAVCLTS